MAIRVPNLGTGNGQTGDNEFKIRSDYNHNFSDQSNAASRLVGTDGAQVPQAQDVLYAAYKTAPTKKLASTDNCNDFAEGMTAFVQTNSTQNAPQLLGQSFSLIDDRVTYRSGVRIQIAWGYTDAALAMRTRRTDDTWTAWRKFYNEANTTLDSNGYIKPSSPVLRVFNDRIEGNTDGDAMAATYTKNGVGDYTITGTTGLRTDGWYITIPNDMNGNPKVAVTLDESDGVVTLRSYVRIFDMTTFKFVPDLNQPLDIPDGRWIDLRFNDLPDEPMPLEV